jgi:hypothetical protein
MATERYRYDEITLSKHVSAAAPSPRSNGVPTVLLGPFLNTRRPGWIYRWNICWAPGPRRSDMATSQLLEG